MPWACDFARGHPQLTPPSATAGFAVFRERDFTLFLIARFFAQVAVQMMVIAVGWQVYHLTGRVIDLGLIGLSQFLPFLCLALFAGHAADVHERGVIIRLCLMAFLVCALLLFIFARLSVASVWPIFGVLAMLGVARAFLSPATQSFVPNIVPVSILGNAIAINSSANQVATIVGPSIGGLIYAFGQSSDAPTYGAQWVFGTAAVLLATGVGLISLLKSRKTSRGAPAASWDQLLEGLRFIWRRKTVLGAISLDLFAVLFGGATALLPAFTKDVLHAGPEVFGCLRAAPGVGAVLMALWLTVSAGAAARRPLYVRWSGPIWGVHHCFRADASVLGGLGRSGAAGRRRHGQCLYPGPFGAARDPGCDPGPGQRRELGIHRGLQ